MRTPALAASLALAVLGCGGGGYYQAEVSATATTPQYVEAAYIDPQVQVVIDSDVPMFYADNYYWRYYGNTWYRSPYADTGWISVEYYALPEHVRRIERPERYAHYRVEPARRVKIPTRDHRPQTVRRDQPTRPEVRPNPTREPDRYYPPRTPERPDDHRDFDQGRGRTPAEPDRPDVKDKPTVRPNPPDVRTPGDQGNARDRAKDKDNGNHDKRFDVDRDKRNDNDRARGNDKNKNDKDKDRDKNKDQDDKDKKDKGRNPDR